MHYNLTARSVPKMPWRVHQGRWKSYRLYHARPVSFVCRNKLARVLYTDWTWSPAILGGGLRYVSSPASREESNEWLHDLIVSGRNTAVLKLKAFWMFVKIYYLSKYFRVVKRCVILTSSWMSVYLCKVLQALAKWKYCENNSLQWCSISGPGHNVVRLKCIQRLLVHVRASTAAIVESRLQVDVPKW